MTTTRFRLYLGTNIGPGYYDRLGNSTVSLYDRSAFLTKVRTAFADGFTVFKADGHWTGADGKLISEMTIIVEIIAKASDHSKVVDLARWYADANGQEAVLVTQEPISSVLVFHSQKNKVNR